MDSFLLAVEPDCDDLGTLAPLGLASTDVGDDMLMWESYLFMPRILFI